MGEEWGADTPWQFFTDHTDPGLAAAVSAGRRSEFAHHGWGATDVPDPQDKETFLRSKLDWDQPAREPYRSLLGWYRALLALRRSRPELADPRFDLVRVDYDEDARWLLMHRGQLIIAANLGEAEAILPSARPPRRSAPQLRPWRLGRDGRRHHAPGHLRDHRPVRREVVGLRLGGSDDRKRCARGRHRSSGFHRPRSAAWARYYIAVSPSSGSACRDARWRRGVDRGRLTGVDAAGPRRATTAEGITTIRLDTESAIVAEFRPDVERGRRWASG